jgi:hypothetical protein
MAFTEVQKTKIRFYLGFPSIHKSANTLLESTIQLSGEDETVKAEAETILANLVAIDERLTTIALDVAGIQSAGQGDPEFFQGGVQGEIRSAGRMQVSRLSSLIGVGIVSDVYGNNGYEGNGWMGSAFQYGVPWGL